jgi:hypothetical protein
MSTTPRTSFSLVLLVLTLAGAARASAADWPVTFRGQPEFDYDREEIIEESKNQRVAERGKAREGTGLLPTLGTLMRRNLVDPFRKESASLVSPTDVPQLELQVSMPALPTISPVDQLNVTEFENYLRTIVNTPPGTEAPDFSNYNFKNDLKRIVIQSLVTSPTPYVLLNGKKLGVGESFLLPVELAAGEDPVEKQINAQMPSEQTVSAAAYKQFKEIRDGALRAYRKKKVEAIKARAGAPLHNVNVSIKEIQHRKVIVSINGRDYELRVGMIL